MLDSIYHNSYDIKINLKSHFLRWKVIILLIITQPCYGHKSVNHKWFIDINASVISFPDPTSYDNLFFQSVHLLP